MIRHRRAGLAVFSFAAVAAITAGCNGDDDGAATTVATPTTEITTTTMETTTTVAETTTASPTTTSTTTLPPTSDSISTPPSTTVEQVDWVAVIEEVYARKNALLAEPAGPARSGEVAEEGSPAFDTLFKTLSDFNANGWHAEVSPFEAARADLTSVDVTTAEGAPRVVRLTVWSEPTQGPGVVDSDGNVVAPPLPNDAPPGALPRGSIVLSRATVDSPWRLVDEISMPPTAP